MPGEIGVNLRFFIIVALGILVMVGIVVIAVLCSLSSGQVTLTSKETIAGDIAQGTLSLGALALVFLGYSLTRRQEKFGTNVAHIHSRVALTMFLLIVLSVLDAAASFGYLSLSSSDSQNNFSWLFDLSFALLFVIGETLVAATTYVVAKEVAN